MFSAIFKCETQNAQVVFFLLGVLFSIFFVCSTPKVGLIPFEWNVTEKCQTITVTLTHNKEINLRMFPKASHSISFPEVSDFMQPGMTAPFGQPQGMHRIFLLRSLSYTGRRDISGRKNIAEENRYQQSCDFFKGLFQDIITFSGFPPLGFRADIWADSKNNCAQLFSAGFQHSCEIILHGNYLPERKNESLNDSNPLIHLFLDFLIYFFWDNSFWSANAWALNALHSIYFLCCIFFSGFRKGLLKIKCLEYLSLPFYTNMMQSGHFPRLIALSPSADLSLVLANHIENDDYPRSTFVPII